MIGVDLIRSDRISNDRLGTDRLENIGLSTHVWVAQVTYIHSWTLVKAFRSEFVLKFVQFHVNVSTCS